MSFESSMIIRASVILLATTLLASILRKASASTRHTVWVMGLSAALILPVALVLLPSINLPVLSDPNTTIIRAPGGDPRSSTETPSLPQPLDISTASPSAGQPATTAVLNPVARRWSSRQWVALAWILGVLVVFLRAARGFREARKLKASSHPIVDDWGAQPLADLKRTLSISAPVELRIGGDTIPPMTWGIFRHTILFPSAAFKWTEDRIRLVIAHELAHVKRKDGLTQLLIQAACAAYWFNPLVWYAAYRMHIERERASDDQVLNLGADAEDYAEHLLHIARGVVSGWSSVTVAMAQSSQLESRLRAILDSARNRRTLSIAATARFLVVTAVLTSLIAAGNLTARPSPRTPSPVRATQPAQRTEAQAGAVNPTPQDGLGEAWFAATDDERKAFQALGTDAARKQFMDQFWLKRDPTPGTVENEFKEEYDVRVAYANQHFGWSGNPGWKTDRGHVYIVYGKPDGIDSHHKDGPPLRSDEVWTYNQIDGLANSVTFTFLGPALNGNYKLSLPFPTLEDLQAAERPAPPPPPSTDPEQAVQAWYRAFDGSAGTRAQYNGYVGGRFDKAYGVLAPSLKDKMTDAAFEETYSELANMKLLQAQLTQIDATAGAADVFVEEERTVVFNGHVPAVAWYEGTLHLTRNGVGWQIAEIDLHPEDLISVNYGGHQPWRNNPIEVARIAVQPLYHVSALPDSCVTPQTDVSSGMADIDVCGDSRDVVRVVRLHSGEWRVIKIESRR